MLRLYTGPSCVTGPSSGPPWGASEALTRLAAGAVTALVCAAPGGGPARRYQGRRRTKDRFYRAAPRGRRVRFAPRVGKPGLQGGGGPCRKLPCAPSCTEA